MATLRPSPFRLATLAVTAVVALTVPAHAADGDDPAALRDQLHDAQARIAALESQVAALVNAAATDPINGGEAPRSLYAEASARERTKLIERLVEDAFRDYDNVGYDNGFFIRSPDGNNLLKVRGFLAVRHIFNDRDGVGDEQVSGFEITRTRFGFMGHVIDPSWQYKIWTGDNATGDNLLLDAWIKKAFDNGWSLTVGQFKLPFYREWLVSEVSLQFIERSLLSKAAAGGYTQGVQADFLNEDVHLTFSVNDGRNALNTSFHDDDGTDAEFGVTARGEWKPFGDWKQQKTFDSFRGSPFAVFVGAAVHYQEENDDPSKEPDQFCWTVDTLLKGDGWNLFVAGVGCDTSSPTKGDFVGFIAQGGWFVTDRVELIGRYEFATSDLAGVADLSVASAGFNVFFHRFNARFASDVGYAFNPIDDRFDSKAVGYLVDTAGEDGQIVVRSQLQLLF